MRGPYRHPIANMWPPGGSTGFVGPLDGLTAPTAAYSVRRLLSSYTGSLIRIRRSSDSTEQDIGYDANGDLDTAAASAFIGGGSGFVAKWYDQSGAGANLIQATASAQPSLNTGNAAFNGRPTAAFVRANAQKLLATISAAAQPYTVLAVAERTGNTTLQQLVYFGVTGGTSEGGFSNAANTVYTYAGATRTATASDSVAHALGWVLNGASSQIIVDQSASTVNPGTNGLSTSFQVGASTGTTQALDGDLAEIVFWNSALGSGTWTTIQAGEKTYFGTP